VVATVVAVEREVVFSDGRFDHVGAEDGLGAGDARRRGRIGCGTMSQPVSHIGTTTATASPRAAALADAAAHPFTVHQLRIARCRLITRLHALRARLVTLAGKAGQRSIATHLTRAAAVLAQTRRDV